MVHGVYAKASDVGRDEMAVRIECAMDIVGRAVRSPGDEHTRYRPMINFAECRIESLLSAAASIEHGRVADPAIGVRSW